MAKVVVMPKLGLTMTEGTVSKWLKKVGDEIKSGEPFFEVETDKLTNTIEANTDGVVRHFWTRLPSLPLRMRISAPCWAAPPLPPPRLKPLPPPLPPLLRLRSERRASASLPLPPPRSWPRSWVSTWPWSPAPAPTAASPWTM